MDTPGQTVVRPVSQGRVVFGLVVMLVGALILLDRLDWRGVRWDVPVWPWILIALGLGRLSGSSDGTGPRRGRRSGVWLLFIGAWGLLNEYRLFGIHYGQSWPILVIGAGAMVVSRSLDHTSDVPVRREP
jgi:hypothetical protein